MRKYVDIRKLLFATLGLLLGWNVFAAPVFAHTLDYAVIKTDMKVKNNVISFKTELPLFIEFSGTQTQTDIKNFYAGYYGQNFAIRQKEFTCNVEISKFDAQSQEQKTFIEGSYTCSNKISGLSELTITNTAFTDLLKTYDHFVRFEQDGKIQEIILKQDTTEYPPKPKNENKKQTKESSQDSKSTGKTSSDSENFFIVVKRFIELGVKHILGGIDHLLFLLAIVLLLTDFRRVAVLVTSFTIAHSITLISASYGLIIVSPKLVEPVIALSIAVMAIRNIWTLKFKKEMELKERWGIIFGFGLFHGLGFAGALAETGIPKEHFFAALISFNIGVELGQFIVLAVVIPYLILLRQHKLRTKILYAISSVIAIVSIFWFFERLL